MATQFDLENERAIIVAALKDGQARLAILGSVADEDFLGERFRVIFQAIRECSAQNLVPDPDSIAVHSCGEDFGGLDFVKRLFNLEPAANLEWHLAKLKGDAARVRVKQRELPDLGRMLTDRSVDIGECLSKLREIASQLGTRNSHAEQGSAEAWCDNLDARCSGKVRFQSVGYPVLDEMLIDGYARGQVSLIAARTRNGKTTLMADSVRRLLSQERKPRICVLPLEIGRLRFLDKLVSSATVMPSKKLRKEAQELTLAERDEAKRIVRKLVGSDDRLVVLENPFFDLPKWDNESALGKIEELIAEGKYDMIFIDLFQRLLTDIRPAPIELALVRVQHLAKQYDVHLCLLHQIGRKAEERKDKRPELNDLKGSGGYEEIPDLILLLHRPKAYKQFRRKDELEIHIGKQRDAEGNLTVIGEFWPEVSRVENVHVPAKKEEKEDEPEAEEEAVY